MIKNQHS